MKRNLEPGQRVFYLPSEYERKRDIKDMVIEKVGRKIFTTTYNKHTKFDVETLKELNNTNYKGQIFIELIDAYNELERIKLVHKLNHSSNLFTNLTLVELKAIDNIIHKEK